MAINNGLPPIHPGIFLKEILDELGISQTAFAQAIGVSPMRISHVIKYDRPVTAELALLQKVSGGETPLKILFGTCLWAIEQKQHADPPGGWCVG